MVKITKANFLSLKQYIPTPLGFLSTNGIAINPMLINRGIITPISTGPK